MKKILFMSILMTVLIVFSCDEEKEEKKKDPGSVLSVKINTETLLTKKYEFENGIKKYPDYNIWHINFQVKSAEDMYFTYANRFQFSIDDSIFQNIQEGDVLDNSNFVLKCNSCEDGLYNKDMTLTIEKWSDENVVLNFSGNIYDGAFEKLFEAKIVTKIERTSNIFTIEDNYDDYDENNKIAIDIPLSGSISLIGHLNNSFGSPALDNFEINYNQAGSYKYFYKFNEVCECITTLHDSSDVLVSKIASNGSYTDEVTMSLARKLQISQGNKWWTKSGDYRLTIAKVD